MTISGFQSTEGGLLTPNTGTTQTPVTFGVCVLGKRRAGKKRCAAFNQKHRSESVHNKDRILSHKHTIKVMPGINLKGESEIKMFSGQISKKKKIQH